MKNTSDISLSGQHAKQQEDSWMSTLLQERDRLFGFIRNRVQNLDDAEDILQDVMFQFVNGFDAIESLENASVWLFTVARNKITDDYRKKKPESFSKHQASHPTEDESTDLYFSNLLSDISSRPDVMYARNEILDELEDALEELPEEQRKVFIWHEFEHKSFKEISALTGVSVNTLLSRKRYAVLYLRDRLQELYDEL